MFVIDKFSETFNTTAASVGGGVSFQVSGQAFYNPVDNILEQATFYISRTGLTTGNATARIYATTGVYGTSAVGTGAALAISDNFDVSTLTTSLALTNFTFSGANKIKLTANTNYIVAVSYTGGTGAIFISIGVYGTSGTLHAGNRARATSALAWGADATNDANFYVYGTFPATNPIAQPDAPTITLPKTYVYKVFDPTSIYIGNLSNVTSLFNYSQNMATSGTQIQIELGQLEPDTKTVNNNIIQVWEYSGYYPNGKLKFTGYISKTKTVVGGNNNMILTCLSHGQDMGMYMVSSGDSTFLSQATDNSNYIDISNDFASDNHTMAVQTFQVASNISMTGLSLEVDATPKASGINYISVTLRRQVGAAPAGSSGGDPNIGSALYQVTTTVSKGVVFMRLNAPSGGAISLTTGNTYYLEILNYYDLTTFHVYASSANPYASGSAYTAHPVYESPTVPVYTIKTGWDLYFIIWQSGGGLSGAYSSQDPSFILSDVLSYYQSAGGLVGRPSLAPPGTAVGFPYTYTSVTYTFKLQTVLAAVQAITALAPAGWGWYVDPATNTLYFDIVKTYPEIIITKGRQVEALEMESTKENITNTAYFVGGDDGTATSTNIFVVKTATKGTNRTGMVLLTDNRVNSTTGGLTTARKIAQNYLDDHASETYYTSITIKDTTTDINLFILGQTVGFNGFNDFIDGLLLQVVGLKYEPDQVTLQLGSIPPRTSNQINQIEASLTSTQTLNAPISPS